MDGNSNKSEVSLLANVSEKEGMYMILAELKILTNTVNNLDKNYQNSNKILSEKIDKNEAALMKEIRSISDDLNKKIADESQTRKDEIAELTADKITILEEKMKDLEIWIFIKKNPWVLIIIIGIIMILGIKEFRDILLHNV